MKKSNAVGMRISGTKLEQRLDRALAEHATAVRTSNITHAAELWAEIEALRAEIGKRREAAQARAAKRSADAKDAWFRQQGVVAEAAEATQKEIEMPAQINDAVVEAVEAAPAPAPKKFFAVLRNSSGAVRHQIERDAYNDIHYWPARVTADMFNHFLKPGQQVRYTCNHYAREADGSVNEVYQATWTVKLNRYQPTGVDVVVSNFNYYTKRVEPAAEPAAEPVVEPVVEPAAEVVEEPAEAPKIATCKIMLMGAEELITVQVPYEMNHTRRSIAKRAWLQHCGIEYDTMRYEAFFDTIEPGGKDVIEWFTIVEYPRPGMMIYAAAVTIAETA